MNSDDTRLDAPLHDDDSFTPSERERWQSLVTAYALGELDAPGKDEVERMLADPAQADARRQVAEVRAIATALEWGVDDEARVRSADLRRAVLAAVTQPEPSRHRPVPRGWMLLGAAIAASLLVVVMLPTLQHVGRASRERLVVDTRGAAAPAEVAKQTPETNTPLEAGGSTGGESVEKSLPQLAHNAVEATAPKAGPLLAAAPAGAAPSSVSDARADGQALRQSPASADKPLPNGKGIEQLAAGNDSMQLRRSAREAEAESAKASRARDRVMADRDEERASVFVQHQTAAGEGYATVAENRAASPKEQPLSTFSIDVDTASYANVRRFLDSGRLPPRDAVRIEELVNYFSYDYPQPTGDVPFSVTVDAAECPWNQGRRLVRIGLQGRTVGGDARPAGNLVFLVDVSGSMQAANKLPLVQQSLSMLVEELTENDRVSLVTYAGNAGLVLPPTTGDQKKTIRDAIQSLAAGGSTHGSAGIALAYEQAREHFIRGGTNRVILATDGDLNVGVTSTDALTDLITEKAKGGVFLTVLGFGEGNLQDEKMEALADHGNGMYAYIDGLREARKVLVEQLTGSTVTIAKDVKIQVEFNPVQVSSYRLLGYENRALAARDFRDDTKDAGDIGAGHRVTAVYEITLADEAAAVSPGVEPLRYQPQAEAKKPATEGAIDPAVSRELLTVKLRWKRPDSDVSTGLAVPLTDRGPTFAEAPADLRFAAAVAAYGMILRGSDQKGEATLPMVATIAGGALGRDEGGYRAEFLDLVRKAEALRGR